MSTEGELTEDARCTRMSHGQQSWAKLPSAASFLPDPWQRAGAGGIP